jgi:hypothetical protein
MPEFNINKTAKRRLFERPTAKLLKELRKRELAFQSEVMAQYWDYVLLKKRGKSLSRGQNAVERDEKLIGRYQATVYTLLRRLYRNGKKAARSEINKAKKKRKKGRVRELETPEGAIAQAVQEKSSFYDAWAVARLNEWAGVVARRRFAQTISHARATVKKAIKEGFTREQFRTALKRRFRHYNPYELDRIIVTESTRAQNLGVFIETKTDSLIVGYLWQVNYVGCPECDAHEAQGFMPKDDITGDDIPPAHPNCECSLIPIFESEPEAIDYMRSEKKAAK